MELETKPQVDRLRSSRGRYSIEFRSTCRVGVQYLR